MTATLTITTMHSPTVVFTTPQNYATRLSHLLTLKSLTPLWCPSIITGPTPQTLSSLSLHLAPHSISPISAIIFPSRTAIAAFHAATLFLTTPLLPRANDHDDDDELIVGVLGRDAELIDTAFLLNICSNIDRIRVLVPPTATPSGLLESLGEGRGRRVLCLAPRVVGLDEPPVVPDFIRELRAARWVPVRVDAYETRWLGPTCAEGIVERREEDGLEGLVFTSSAEVEGLLRSLNEYGWEWRTVRRRWPDLVVAAHGPVTAAGADRLGVDVDVVSDRFSSFDGVVDAIHSRLVARFGF